ncbi:hypothetical protein BC832DRAFT_592637 [Gaertneriomyces semiglobifer]|nr:hypothetical protein BC832DRAFT_592637 [Gaertneriomyces semiglobifer]
MPGRSLRQQKTASKEPSGLKKLAAALRDSRDTRRGSASSTSSNSSDSGDRILSGHENRHSGVHRPGSPSVRLQSRNASARSDEQPIPVSFFQHNSTSRPYKYRYSSGSMGPDTIRLSNSRTGSTSSLASSTSASSVYRDGSPLSSSPRHSKVSLCANPEARRVSFGQAYVYPIDTSEPPSRRASESTSRPVLVEGSCE